MDFRDHGTGNSGPVELERFLALELQPGALSGARGLVRATGDFAEAPRWLCAA